MAIKCVFTALINILIVYEKIVLWGIVNKSSSQSVEFLFKVSSSHRVSVKNLISKN